MPAAIERLAGTRGRRIPHPPAASSILRELEAPAQPPRPMSLRYHFRGADAEQLRRMRAAAAHAMGAPLGLEAAADVEAAARRTVAAGAAAFRCLGIAAEPPCASAAAPAPAVCGGAAGWAATGHAGPVDAAWARLDGDGTPWSYLCASVLRRELCAALPAAPHLVELPPWGRQELLDQPPPGPEAWTWLTAAPSDWRLMVMEDTRRVLVRMYTLAGFGDGAAVLMHEDWYRRGEGYEARGIARPLARWGQGASEGAPSPPPGPSPPR